MRNKIVATLVFLQKNDQILLAMKKRGFGEGKYNGVGGKPELGESIEQTVVREAKEEIGVKLIDFEKNAEIIFDEFFKGNPTTMHVHVFTASKWSGKPVESEEMAPKWFKTNNLPYDQMWQDDPFWVPEVINGKKVLAKFKLDESDKIVSKNVKIVDSFDN